MPDAFPPGLGFVRARDVLPDPDRFRGFDSVAEYPAEATALGLSGRKKDETRGWEELPERTRVDSVMLYQGREPHVEWLARMPGLKKLGLLNPKLEDWTVLSQLTRLQVLFIEDANTLTTLQFVGPLKSLHALAVFDAKRLTELDGVERLQQLEALSLQCGMWNDLKLSTIGPLGKVASLQELRLHALVQDRSLQPLAALKKLQKLGLNLQAPYIELAKLGAFLPESICPYLSEPYELQHLCKRDKSHQTVLPADGVKRFCRDCHPEKFEAYLSEFARIREETRRRGTW